MQSPSPTSEARRLFRVLIKLCDILYRADGVVAEDLA